METPIFVKIEQYKELTSLLAAIDQKVNEASLLLEKLEALKAQEEEQLKSWGTALEQVKARSVSINTALFTR